MSDTTDPPIAPVYPPKQPNIAALVVFSAEWCGPAVSYMPVLEAVRDTPVPGDTPTTLEVRDIDKDTDLATKLGVIACPTVVALDATGAPLGLLLGTRTEDVVREWMRDPTQDMDPA